jgi:hypothetical protein
MGQAPGVFVIGELETMRELVARPGPSSLKRNALSSGVLFTLSCAALSSFAAVQHFQLSKQHRLL